MKADEFLNQIANTVNKLELLVFFHDNPSTIDSADSLSIWTGIPYDLLLDILNQWVNLDIIKREGNLFFYNIDNIYHNIADEVISNYKTTRNLFRKELQKLVTEKDKEVLNQKIALNSEIGKTDTLLANITDGVLIINNDLVIIRANNAFCKQFPDFQIDKLPIPFHDAFIDSQLKEEIISLSQRGEGIYIKNIDAKHFEITITGIKNSSGQLIFDDETGKTSAYLWFFRDVSAKIELDQMKEELSRMITHDLRSPMTGIFTAFDLILRHDQNLLPEHLYKSCQLGKRTSQFILGMVNDLVDIHRIKEDKIPVEQLPLDFYSVLNESIEQIELLAKDRNIKLNVKITDEKMPIIGDYQKLVRVIVNLLNNAVKYTPKEGKINISLRYLVDDIIPDYLNFVPSKQNNYLVLSVKDNGFGIPNESLPYIFDKYYRVKKRKYFTVIGSGLGLYFCKLIVHAHEGLIWAESKLEKGSTFSLLLPLTK